MIPGTVSVPPFRFRTLTAAAVVELCKSKLPVVENVALSRIVNVIVPPEAVPPPSEKTPKDTDALS